MIINLFKTINENKGCAVSLSICSVVKDEALSNFETYSIIKNALFASLEGQYEMEVGLPGYNYIEGISEEGLLINLGPSQQLFIPESSKIKVNKSEGNISFDIKDSYSSMHIKLQVLTGAKVTS